MARVATVVFGVRAAKGAKSVVVVDNGDGIQGAPLTYYYRLGAGAAGVKAGTTTHPMAQVYNAIGYDGRVVGNHEDNYGPEMLDAYEDDLDFPLLGANVIEDATGEPCHQPCTLLERTIDGETVTIGVPGLGDPRRADLGPPARRRHPHVPGHGDRGAGVGAGGRRAGRRRRRHRAHR